MRGMVVGLAALLLATAALVAAAAQGAVAESAAAEGMVAADAARLSRAASRCTRLAELISCDEALNIKPNDPELLVAEADALVRMKRPGEAIGVYRNALTVGARPDAVNPKIAQAQAQRQALLDLCMRQVGEVAERACESAWLPGASDEVTVFKRRGLLLQGETQLPAALDAYMAAARLSPKDRGVAREVVNLSGSTGRKDAPTLTALGTAFMTLGRPADAIAAFRQALRLAPGDTVAKDRLRLAQRAATDAESHASLAAAPAAAADGDASNVSYTNETEETRSN